MKRFKRLFRKLDIYALPITLRYKGEKKFFTNFGALTSLFVIIAMLALLLNEISKMTSMTDITSMQVTKLTSLKPDYSANPNQLGTDFMFGFRFIDQQGNDFKDESILQPEIAVYERNWTLVNETEGTWTYVDIPSVLETVSCSVHRNNFNFTSLQSDQLQRAQFDDYTCPIYVPDTFMRATLFESDFMYTSVRVRRCVEGNSQNVTCNTDT
mmetsp:Transcript_33378/g.24128  ORF Transcript_33378/g.24128 Transcript_33378/m.24128 type:complete len:212 (+) Transcript_33378:75-710(+)